MSDDLRSALIRLAAEKPELRADLLPLLKEAALSLLPGHQRLTVPFNLQVEVEYPLELEVDEEGRVAGYTSPTLQQIAAYVAANPRSVGSATYPKMDSSSALQRRVNYHLKQKG